MLPATWKGNNSLNGRRKVVTSETVANMEVGGRAYRDVLAACLRSNDFTRASRHLQQALTFPLFLLGALVRISYAALMRGMTDEQLMHRYAKGDAKAFDQLYDRHRGPLYRYFIRQVNNVAIANQYSP